MSERKYGQRGYQDSGPRPPREDRPDRPARRPDVFETGPRGRGVGRPTATVFRCAACGAKQPTDKVAVGSNCVGCGGALHTCTNCRHFDPAAPAECRKPVPARIASKAKENTCELFEPRETKETAPPSGPGSRGARPSAGKTAFDALFDR